MTAPRPMLEAVATRADLATGGHEEVAFFGPSGGRLFGCLHLPPAEPSGGVVICCSVNTEFENNYRREAMLGWALAARGLVACRFHYRGAGHSDGLAEDLSFQSMIEDTRLALDHLAARCNVPSVAFLGTRLGGLVAASLSAERSGAPLALWDPVVDADSYFREMFRASFMARMREAAPGERPPSGDQLLAELRRAGRVDVLGQTIGLALYRSLAGRRLEAVVGERPPSVLMVQLGRTPRPGPARDLLERWRARGFEVDEDAGQESEQWWFGDHRRGGQAVIGRTADWLAERLGASP